MIQAWLGRDWHGWVRLVKAWRVSARLGTTRQGFMSKARRVVEAVQDLQPRPTVDAVIDHFMQFAGGADAFAKMLFDEYTASAAGSMIRAKIVETILRRMEKSEERNRIDDFGALSMEDLKNMLSAREAVMQSQVREKEDAPTDGEEKTPGEP